MKTRFYTPEEREAFETGRKLGKIEGMLSYMNHVIKNMEAERDKIVDKLHGKDNQNSNEG
jgi:hypothetical protein